MVAPLEIFNTIVGVVGTAYGIIDSLASHGSDGDFGVALEEFFNADSETDRLINDLSDQVRDGFNDIQDSLVTLQTELTDLITGQLGEVRQQALMSALARSESALDLLSSLDTGLPIDPGFIIAEASLGLRDVLAQATTIATRTSTYTPSVGDISVAVGAVGVALAARTQVAIALENDLIGSSAMNEQFRDTADFFRDAVEHFRTVFEFDRSFVARTINNVSFVDLGTLRIPNATGLEWVQFDPQTGTDFDPLRAIIQGDSNSLFFSPTLFQLDVLQQRLFDAAGSPFFGRFAELVTVNSGGGWIVNVSDPNGDGRELAYLMAEFDTEDFALSTVGAGQAGATFFQIADNYDSLADGDEQVLSAPAGRDASGTLTGDLDGPGKDLLIGNIGNDVLNGLDGNDILRGRDGNDTLNGGNGEDRLEGGAGNDVLNGGADNDELFGAEGDDLINGGLGFDKAGFQGDRADYIIDHGNFSYGGGVFFDRVLVDGPDGRDVLSSVERLFFADRTLTVGVETAANSTMTGGTGDDILWHYGAGGRLEGGTGNDELIGRGAGQTFVGGVGNDVMTVDTALTSLGDVAVFSANRSTYLITSPNIDTLEILGPDGRDTLSQGFDRLEFLDTSINLFYGTTGSAVNGSGGEDIIFQLAGGPVFAQGGNDLILSQTPAASPLQAFLDGGTGTDTVRIFGDLEDHTVRFAHGAFRGDIATIQGPDGTRALRNVELVQFDEAATEQENDAFGVEVGTTAGNDIVGFEGDEIILGLGGDDLIDVSQILILGPARPNPFSVFLSGGDGSDTLIGGTGDDVLDGGRGLDRLTGGAGTDTAVLIGRPDDWEFRFISGDVVATPRAGTIAEAYGIKRLNGIEKVEFQTEDAELIAVAEVVFNTSTDSASDADELIFISFLANVSARGGADTVVGTVGADVLDGGAGDDVIDAREGNDVVIGGAGSDRLIGGTGFDAFVFRLQGTSQIDTIVDFEPGVDRLFIDTMFYNTVASGEDIILDFGGGELVILEGLVRNPLQDGDIALYRPGVIAPSDWQGAVVIGDAGNNDLNGRTSDDTLIGNAGDDTLTGAAGADDLDGGADFDVASYAGSSAGVTVRLWTGTGAGGDAEGDTLRGIEGLIGSDHNDRLIGAFGQDDLLVGGAGNDSLAGLSGDDTLRGGAGADTLVGDVGIDTADYSGSASRVAVRLWTGLGIGGDAAGDVLSGIEALIGSDHDDRLVGDFGKADRLEGGAGDDFLKGLSGNDTLVGGIGADTLEGDEGTDTADYSASGAGVTVRLWTGLGQGGDAEGDQLFAIESLVGSDHDDVFVGNFGQADRLAGGLGNDSLKGLSGNDTLLGGAGRDTLVGDQGNDVLRGGADRDLLTGGLDQDVFLFVEVTDSGIGASRDQILDFEVGIDRIDVSGMASGVFQFLGAAAFGSGGNAELRLVETGGSTVVELDVNGDGLTDAEILVGGVVGLTAADFVL